MKSLTLLLASMILIPLTGQNYQLELSTDKPDAIYKSGDSVQFSIRLLDGKKPAEGKILKYSLRDAKQSSGTLHTGKEVLTVSSGLPYPGWMFLSVSAFEADGKTPLKQKNRNIQAQIGAMTDPYQMKTGIPEPKDFDAFWRSCRAEVSKVPLTPIEKLEFKNEKTVCWNVECPAPGGMPVRGYLTLPPDAKPKSLPALLSLHGAGHKSASKGNRSGFLRLEINVHGILNGQPDSYYNDLFRSVLKDYPRQGRTSRDTCYFKGVYLRLMRAMDYLKSRPEWNGRDLVVEGTSMGGAQALAAAALEPRVTVCIANDPAIIDHKGALDHPSRAPGWPHLIDPKDPRTIETAGYYDSIHFARRIHCDAYIASGFADTTCPSSGVLIAYNGIQGKKILTTNPKAGHCATRNLPGWKRMEQIAKGK